MPLPVIPPAMSIDGDVVAVHSFWTRDGSRIVTEATVHTAAGDDVVVSQLGGTVDGIGMIMMPGPAPLVVGMSVAVAAHHAVDLAQQDHVVLDSVATRGFLPEFVRTGPTNAGKYLYWESHSVPVTPDSAATTALPAAHVFTIIANSMTTWSTGVAACSDMKMINQPPKASEVGRDNVNLVKFRDTTWGRPAIGNDPARTYNPQAAAITTVIYVNDKNSSRDGAIIDADVEVNGVDFAISENCTPGQPGTCQTMKTGNLTAAELQNTLTHELGHLQGLEHPCRVMGDPERVDDQGAAVPLCSGNLPPKITEATMYNFQDSGETKKETLSDDDIQAICTVYPPDSGGCCSVAGRGARPDVGVVLAAATVLTLRRRRKLR